MRLHEVTAGASESDSPLRVPQEAHDRVGEIAGVVRGHEVATRLEPQSLGAHRRRYDRFGHGQRLEDLEARAAARAERNNVDAGLGDGRPDVIHRPGHTDTGPRGQLAKPCGRVAADDRDRDTWHVRADTRQDRVGEVHDRILIGMPVH